MAGDILVFIARHMQKKAVRYVGVVTVAVYFGILANGFGNLLWLTALSNYPSFPTITKHLIAALIEPITTKLVPAVSVIAYVRLYSPSLQRYVSVRFIRLAVLFGLTAGLVEFSLYFYQSRTSIALCRCSLRRSLSLSVPACLDAHSHWYSRDAPGPVPCWLPSGGFYRRQDSDFIQTSSKNFRNT
jgi:hypothetical protein